jgi:hypothetical protein
MNLKPWREIAVPHEDVLKGTFHQAELAVDLSRVYAGEGGLGWNAWRANATAHGRR